MGNVKEQGSSNRWAFAKDILLVVVVLVVATGLAFAVTLVSRPTVQSAFDFSLDISPPSRAIAPGNSTNATVTATSVSASPRDLQFSCADLPAGAACSFTPASCRPSCTTELVLSTSLTTPTGAYVVIVVASDGTISRTTTFSVDLSASPPPPAFDFAVGIQPASAAISPGGNATTNVTATRISGTARAVQYSCSKLPAGVTCTFVPPSCTPTCTAVLTLGAAANTRAGTYAINVSASDGAVSRSASYSLNVSNVAQVKTLTFQKGDGNVYSRTQDAYIYSGAPNTSFGYDKILLVDGVNCIANHTICRSLLKFPSFVGPNARQVPINATIISAMVEMNVTNAGRDQRMYQVTEAWNESTATWNHFATPGMPRSKGPTTIFNTTLGLNRLNITKIAQNWVRGDVNQGVFIWSPSWDGSDYQSSESNHPPKLTVTFRVGPRVQALRSEPSSVPRALENSRVSSMPRASEGASWTANAIAGFAIAAPNERSRSRLPVPAHSGANGA